MRQKAQAHFELWSPISKRCSHVNSILFAVILLGSFSETIGSQFLVKTLPGLLGDLPFTLETGYVGVGESDDVQLFYYFIESEGNPKDDPLMLWLTGGPGCSGLSGLVYEIGPFTVDYENSTFEKAMLELNPYSWTKVANIIFIDQPVGAGFSYAKTSEAYILNDTISVAHTYDFLQKWLLDHPKFQKNPLYIGGDSYCGIVLPMIVLQIYNGNEVGDTPWMNIKGYLLGNPLTDTYGNYNSKIRFSHRLGLISDALYKSAKANCHGEYWKIDTSNIPCRSDLEVIAQCLERIRTTQILEPACESQWTISNLPRRDIRSLGENSMDIGSSPHFQKEWCRDDNYLYSAIWANSRDVQEALHVYEGFSKIGWARCNASIKFDYGKKAISYTHNVLSSFDCHQRLAEKNCRTLIYSGDHDMVVPYFDTSEWIESLNIPVETDWRPWLVKEQVAGYTMKYSKEDYTLTFATVKGAGHTAPEYKPQQCLTMISKWFANEPL